MTDRLVWYGQWTTRRRLLMRGWGCLGGGMLWLGLFLVLPCLMLVALAFATRGPYGEVIFAERGPDGHLVWRLTLDHFRKLAGFGVLGWSADYLWILLRTLWMAGLTTLACVLLAYPIAFFLAARSTRWRYFWLVLVVVPLCTNLVIRTYAWQLIFAPQWPAARLAAWLGLIAQGDAIYPGRLAVYIGMVTSGLPFAVLPIYTNVERLDWSLVEAAQDLYGSSWRVLRHAILPQTWPGLAVALIITFIPAMGVFLVPDLLGGAKQMYLGSLIQQQFGPSRNFPLGAAISLVLVLLTLGGLRLFQSRGQRGEVL